MRKPLHVIVTVFPFFCGLKNIILNVSLFNSGEFAFSGDPPEYLTAALWPIADFFIAKVRICSLDIPVRRLSSSAECPKKELV